MSPTWRNILLVGAIIFLVGGALSLVNLSEPKTLDVGTFVSHVQAGKVKEIVIEDQKLKVTLTDDSQVVVAKESSESLSSLLKNYGVDPEKARGIKTTVKQATGIGYWAGAVLPTVIPFLLIFGLMFFFFRQVQGQNNRAMSFGQSTARETDKGKKDKITFADVAGDKEAKQELEEVVEFLKSPDKFVKLGAKIPRGVLLMGAPGTGKTLLARAVAGEADVPFFHMSGSEFVEMFVGVGASRVRDLFAKAKKNAPCIVFIDEIDAVGRQRGAGLGGSHDEREQTLNQILVEMDGFEPNLGVIVIAATNRPDVLDPALLRPGRFDRRVMLDLPDINDREAILQIHAKNKPLAKDVSIRQLAERTPGFSGADLGNLMNEGAILAARRNQTDVRMTDLIESIEKVMLGPERRSHLMNEEERKITAFHEGGHALVAHLEPHMDPVQKVSIISRGRAAGYTIRLPMEDKHMRNKEEYTEDLAVMLGGYAAEKIFFGQVTTGASNDMQQATKLAKSMVTQWGMSDVMGPRVYGERADMIFLGREITESRDYSESRAEKIDQEVDALINHGLVAATKFINEHKDAMQRIADHLMKHETIERHEFAKVVGMPPANAKNIISGTSQE
ncbi:ATP-dependent metallopeptidase FtsH/Yme1/Tma family protein [Candidatus Uhrbacteria bacterium]|nr:ATP-dependent metallopeptidase FtsH/Yme1/Tma family protein [Candidatus Uhrbacteria bacterium]